MIVIIVIMIIKNNNNNKTWCKEMADSCVPECSVIFYCVSLISWYQ